MPIDTNVTAFIFAVISDGFWSGFDWIPLCNHVLEAR